VRQENFGMINNVAAEISDLDTASDRSFDRCRLGYSEHEPTRETPAKIPHTSRNTPPAALNMNQQSRIAENLKPLTNLVTNMSIARVFSF
jgi:hypothetical protein